MEILGLGYIGLDVPDVGAWAAFAHDIIGLDHGLAPSEAGPDGSAYLRIDDWSWRIALHPARAAGIAYVGLEVRGKNELAACLSAIEKAGYPARTGTAAEASARSVTGIGFTTDPGGNPIEIFYGPLVTNKYRNAHGMAFLTGALGMGHINLFVSDYAKSSAFYQDVLGFRLTDYYDLGSGQKVNFFHTNPRHHTIGLMELVPVDRLHHLMLEVCELDMVGLAYDRVLASGHKVTSTLGRHSNDEIVSFYVESPSGAEVEIGWGARTVDASWTPRFRRPGDIWGHHGLTGDAIMRSAQEGGSEE